MGLECSRMFVCVGGWQAIWYSFTLYVSLLCCCKSQSLSVHDHPPPGWITSAFALVFFCCMCFGLINHGATLWFLYTVPFCEQAVTLSSGICWTESVERVKLLLICVMAGVMLRLLWWCHGMRRRQTHNLFSLLAAWRCHLYYGLITSVSLLPQSISPPEIWPMTRKTVWR